MFAYCCSLMGMTIYKSPHKLSWIPIPTFMTIDPKFCSKICILKIFERIKFSDTSVYNIKLKFLLWTNVLYVLKSLPWNISQHLLIKPSIVQRPWLDILDRVGEYLENLWNILEKCLWMYSNFWMSSPKFRGLWSWGKNNSFPYKSIYNWRELKTLVLPYWVIGSLK